MNRAELVDVISADYDGNKAEASKALDAVVRSISHELAAGGKVSIAGFGVFEAVARPPRVVRDPETGKQRRIKSPATPHFRAGAELKAYTSGAKKPPKPSTAAVLSRRAAAGKVARLTTDRGRSNLVRHLIEFDPKQAADYLFAATPGSEQALALAAQAQPPTIPWPEGLAPIACRTASKPTPTAPLPTADVLIVAHHTAEAQALADILTPGWTLNRWYRYRNGWRHLRDAVQVGAPSRDRDQAGRWATCRIGGTSVVLVKSDLHPGTDGQHLPMQQLWRQMLEQVQPQLTLTTGAAGGLGPDVDVGDIMISRHVRWNAAASHANQPWATRAYASTAKLRPGQFTLATRTLLPAADGYVPAERPRRLFTDTSHHRTSVITTDFLPAAADRAELLPHLHSARAVEMTDAALGTAYANLEQSPSWMSVRTAYDAQTDTADRHEGRREAAAAYERLAYWASVSSAITCWSLVAPAGNQVVDPIAASQGYC